MFEKKWYACLITDEEDRTEPDWDLVPEDRRELVRSRWLNRNPIIPRKWKLWGPQIPFYQRILGMTVKVLKANSV